MGYLKRTWTALVAKVDIPKPTAWPPPKDEQRVTELLEYGYKRDPVGDKIHTAFACLCMFALPLDEVPSSIALLIMCIHSLMRLPSTWRTLTPLYNSTVFRCMIAWSLWSLVSILWSSNQAAGLDHAAALRMTLLPVVLWPVMRHWKYFLGAFLAGVFIQNTVQLSEFAGSWFLDGQDWLKGGQLGSMTGFEKHSGKLAMFCGFAALAWMRVLSTNQYRKTAITGLIFCIGGMVVTASLAVALGFIVAIASICSLALFYKKASVKQVFATVFVLIVVVFSTALTTKEALQSKIQLAAQGLEDFSEGNIEGNNSTIMRLHWWSLTLKQSFDEPAIQHGIFGHGLGSVSTIDFSKPNSTIRKTADHTHNSYVQLLYEEGLIGLALFFLIFWAMIRTAKSITENTNWAQYPICVSGVLFWAVVTFFENSQSSGRPLAMLFLLGVFIMYKNKVTSGVKQS